MMSNSSGGSFIPKRSTGKVKPMRVGRRIYIFSYIAYALFFGTLLSVMGIFFLHNQAEARLQEYIALVDKERQGFEEQREIIEIKNLDTQLKTAQQILAWHVAPSVIFDALEDSIVSSMQIASFQYLRQTGGPAQVTFTGRTSSFDALLFQREIISQNSLLASADIVNVNYGSVSSSNQKPTGTEVRNDESVSVEFVFDEETFTETLGYEPRTFERIISDQETNDVMPPETEEVEGAAETEVTEEIVSETDMDIPENADEETGPESTQ